MRIPPKVFTGRRPFSGFSVPIIISKITGGERPARPQEAQELGLMDPLWDITVRCWDQNLAQRPTMIEVARPLREWLVLSLHMNGISVMMRFWYSYRVAAGTIKITDIPAEVLVNNVLPFCRTKDAVSLGCTNKFFALAVADETFWQQKVAVDYKFTGPDTNNIYGWKLIYQRLGKPQDFWWEYVTFSFCYLMRAANLLVTHTCLT